MTVNNLILMLRERQKQRNRDTNRETNIFISLPHSVDDRKNLLRDLTGPWNHSWEPLCLQAVSRGNHSWIDEEAIFKVLQNRCFHILPWKCLSWYSSYITDLHFLDYIVSISALSFQKKIERKNKKTGLLFAQETLIY